MTYRENPKTKGSGIKCCIPQTDPQCPFKCADCFYQSGRSYLEPLEDTIPNMPSPEEAEGCVIRVNDGNDSSVMHAACMRACARFPDKFYNTSWPRYLEDFDAPVVLTLNPGKMTDTEFHKVDPIPTNLMMVRFRTNVWNLHILQDAVEYYTARGIPVILTWMAYHDVDSIPDEHRDCYDERKRTMNTYFAIKTEVWREICSRFMGYLLVHTCGQVEGVSEGTACRYCGNCLREYYATKERMKA